MTIGDNPRLCGGTFFVLVLQALKQRVKARQHYKEFNELNRTHWSIKRCDLIQELLEGGVQIPVFTIGDSH